MIIMFWVFRCAFDVYAILCVMALRHEILRSGESHVKNLTPARDSENLSIGDSKKLGRESTTKKGKKVELKPGAALQAIAKTGLGPSTSLFSSQIDDTFDDKAHKDHLDALHNAAATADIQQQLLLMSAAQHLASASGLLAPAVGVANQQQSLIGNRLTPVNSNQSGSLQQRNSLLSNASSTQQQQQQQLQQQQPQFKKASVGNLIDFSSSVHGGSFDSTYMANEMEQGRNSMASLVVDMNQNKRALPQIPQININDRRMSLLQMHNRATIDSTGQQMLPNNQIPQTTSPPQQRRVTGWGMSKYLLKQQQQALAIATGLHKSGLLPTDAPLYAIAKQAVEQKKRDDEIERRQNSSPKVGNLIGTDEEFNSNADSYLIGKENVGRAASSGADTGLTVNTKRYAKQWLQLSNSTQSGSDFCSYNSC